MSDKIKLITAVTNTSQVGYVHALKASCEFYNLELVTLVAENWDTHRVKIKMLKEYLSKNDKNELIMYVDGYDVIMLQDEENILMKYKKLCPNNEILIAADRFCSPDKTLAKKFQSTKFGYDYINAGTFMGMSKDILDFLNRLEEIAHRQDSDKQYEWCDQYLFKKAFLQNSDIIKLDNTCEIFQTVTTDETIKQMYNYRNNEPELAESEDLYLRRSLTMSIKDILNEIKILPDQKVFNKNTKTLPSVLHFNLETSKLVMFMEPFVKLIDKVN